MAFFTPLITEFSKSEELSNSFQATLAANSLALLLTAIIQTRRNQLTLFHAVCVIHLISLLGINGFSQPDRKKILSPRFVLGMSLYCIGYLTFVGFSIYVWSTAPQFGSQLECNSSTVYVVLGAAFPVVSPVFRWLLVAQCSIMAFALIIVTIMLFPLISVAKKILKLVPLAPARSTPLVRVTAHIAIWTYAVVTFEQLLQRNTLSPGASQWSFGQILAMILLLYPAFEATCYFFGRFRHAGHSGADATTEGIIRTEDRAEISSTSRLS